MESGTAVGDGTRRRAGGDVCRLTVGAVGRTIDGAADRSVGRAAGAGGPDGVAPAVVADDVAFAIDGSATGLVAADVNGDAVVAVAAGFGLRGGSEEDENGGGDGC